jgi:RNA polymerase sigma-70 factor (ECF subfamily)
MVWLARRSRAAAPRQATPDASADAALIAAAQADPRAFLALYERYADRIYGYCYARLGSREAAEDATSEVFTKALAALGRYQDILFAAWLFRIAHNVVADVHRRRPVAPLDTAADRPDPARGPDESAIATAEWAAVRAALAALPDDQRAAIELPYAGWTGEEIAAQLGRSPAAIKQLRYRAMQRLRTLLARSGHVPEEAHDA